MNHYTIEKYMFPCQIIGDQSLKLKYMHGFLEPHDTESIAQTSIQLQIESDSPLFCWPFLCAENIPWMFRSVLRAIKLWFLDYQDITVHDRLLWQCALIRSRCPLTHWSQNKMVANLQMIFSNAFCWKKIVVFWFQFHLKLFLRVQLRMSYHSWLPNLASVRSRDTYDRKCTFRRGSQFSIRKFQTDFLEGKCMYFN